MTDVGKHFVLHWQEGTARVHQVNAWQVVLVSHRLRSDVFFHRHWIIRAALDRGIVGHKEAFTSVDHADSRHDASRVGSSVVQVVGRQRRKLQEGGTGVNDAFDSLPCKVLAP